MQPSSVIAELSDMNHQKLTYYYVEKSYAGHGFSGSPVFLISKPHNIIHFIGVFSSSNSMINIGFITRYKYLFDKIHSE